MSGSWNRTLIKQLEDKSFRDAYVAEDIRTSVAFQLRAMRDQREWSQAELGRHAGKPQSVIARLEDPDYGRFSLKTLFEMANTFDVALLVRFVPFSELMRRNTDLSPEALAAVDFVHDDELKTMDVEVHSWTPSNLAGYDNVTYLPSYIRAVEAGTDSRDNSPPGARSEPNFFVRA